MSRRIINTKLLYETCFTNKSLVLRGCSMNILRPASNSLYVVRFSHNNNPSPEEQLQIDSAQDWLNQLTPSSIPKNCLDIKFIRSSGPGGQKVNKTSSKAMVHISDLMWIPNMIRSQIVQNNFRYLNKSQLGFTIADDTTRSRDDNLKNCLEKFIKEMKNTVKFKGIISHENLTKWDNVRKKTNEDRLREKHKKSDKKNSRRENKRVDYF